MPPQFRGNLSVAPKLTPIMIANVRIDLCSPNRRRIKFPFCPPNKDNKYLCLLLRQHLSCSILLPPLLFKNASAPPPSTESQAKHLRGLRSLPIGIQKPPMASISEIPEVHFSSTTLLFFLHPSFRFIFRTLFFLSRILGAT